MSSAAWSSNSGAARLANDHLSQLAGCLDADLERRAAGHIGQVPEFREVLFANGLDPAFPVVEVASNDRLARIRADDELPRIVVMDLQGRVLVLGQWQTSCRCRARAQ